MAQAKEAQLIEETRALYERLPRRIRNTHVAAATGLHEVWIGRFEQGKGNPDLEKVKRLNAFLRTHVAAVDHYQASTPTAVEVVRVRPPRSIRSPCTGEETSDIRKLSPITYTVNEAACVLGISERSVYNRIYDGSLAKVRLGGRVLIPVAAVHAFAAGGE